MSALRMVYGLLILSAVAVTSFFMGADYGHDVGYKGGYSQAILDGKVEVTCSFPCKEGRSRE